MEELRGLVMELLPGGLLHRGETSSGMLKVMRRCYRVRPVLSPGSAFAGFWFPREVIVLTSNDIELLDYGHI